MPGNYAGQIIAGEWRREVRRFEKWWSLERAKRAKDARDIERIIKAAKRLKPKDLRSLRKAVSKLRKRKS